jgi:hypothetical protein
VRITAYKPCDKTSGWILAVETQNKNAEHEWIAKYRAAVSEIPAKQRGLAKIRATLGAAWRKAVSPINRSVDQEPLNTESQAGRSSVKTSGLRLEKATDRKPAINAFAKNPPAEDRGRGTAS